MKDKEVQAYLSLVFHRVERLNEDFYALYDKNDTNSYNVADSEGNLLTDIKVYDFERIGPFVRFKTCNLNYIKEVDRDLDQERYMGSYYLAIRLSDMRTLGVSGALKARRVYSVTKIRTITVTSYEGSYGFYILSSSYGESAIFTKSGDQLTPFAFMIRNKAKAIGKYIVFTVRSSIEEYAIENKYDWFDIKYDKVLKKIIDYGTFRIGLDGDRYKTVVGLQTIVKNYQKNSLVPTFRKVGKRMIYKPIWQLTDSSGNPRSAVYGSIEQCDVKLYNNELYRVRLPNIEKRCYGYITKDGFEVIAPEKFLISEPIGNSGLFIVVDNFTDKETSYIQKHGIWDGKAQKCVQDLNLDKRYIWKKLGKNKELNILVSIKVDQGKTVYSIVGNDGKDYEDLQTAFEIYSNRQGLYIIILYGEKYYFTAKSFKDLELVSTHIVDSDYSWEKLK